MEGITFIVSMLHFRLLCLFIRYVGVLRFCALRNEDDVVAIALLCCLSVVLCELSGSVVLCCKILKVNGFAFPRALFCAVKVAVELAHHDFLPMVQFVLRPAFLTSQVLSDDVGLWVVAGAIDSGDDVFVFEVGRASVGVAAFLCDHLFLALH